jgi:hypothetical protein
MASTISPNMSLVVPTTAVEPGPAFANDVNASLNIIDSHNHSPGSGVQIQPSGLNISSDLTFQDNNALDLRSCRFFNNSSPLSGAADIGCIYEAGGELYYNDASSNQVQITKSGSVNATSSGISSGTASAAFSGGVLVVNQASNTPGNIQAGSILIGDNVPASNFVTLAAPGSLAANYTLTFPGSLPGSGVTFLTVDSSGNIGDVATVDNVTLQFSSNLLSIKNGGVGNAQIANNAIGINQISTSACDDTSITVAGGVLTLVNAGFIRGADFSINTNGVAFAYGSSPNFTSKTGKVRITLCPRADAGSSYIYLASSGSTSTLSVTLDFFQGANVVASMPYAMNISTTSGASYQVPVGQSFLVNATIGTTLGYNLRATFSTNASGGGNTIIPGSLFVEDVTY